ncbi:hypothetical protein KAU33_12840, partial [Candidatus Dependentiae bacterium]|nr:hypothetical protein [Candidatus Dependentiae bacterium]
KRRKEKQKIKNFNSDFKWTCKELINIVYIFRTSVGDETPLFMYKVRARHAVTLLLSTKRLLSVLCYLLSVHLFFLINRINYDILYLDIGSLELIW